LRASASSLAAISSSSCSLAALIFPSPSDPHSSSSFAPRTQKRWHVAGFLVVRKVDSRFGNIVGLTFQARPFHGLRVAGAAENHFLAANHNHDVADPGIRITSDGSLRERTSRSWPWPVAPNAANRVPGRTLRGTTAFQRTQVPGVGAHAVQRENLMQGHTPAFFGENAASHNEYFGTHGPECRL
jgi:hypothetical protein